MIRTDLFLADGCEACSGKGRVVEQDEDGQYLVQCAACGGDGAERCVGCDGPANWLVTAKDDRARTWCDVERVHACGACVDEVKDLARDNYARRATFLEALRNASCERCVLLRFTYGERAERDSICTHSAVSA